MWVDSTAEGHYQFIDVPTGKYRVQAGGTGVEGGTEGFLVRKVQQNITVSKISVAASLTPTPTAPPTFIPTSTPLAAPTNTPTPTPTPAPAIVGSTLVALTTYHGRYVTAMGADRDWVLRAETTEPRNWEIFTLLCLNNDKVALETYHGRYVTAMDDQPGFDWELRAETTTLSHWEEFTLIEAETGEQLPCLEAFRLFGQGSVRIALKTYHGRYVTAMADQPGFDWELRAETTELWDWEKFTVVLPLAVTGKVCQIKSGWDTDTIFLRQAEFDILGLSIGQKVIVAMRDTGRSVEGVTLGLDSDLEICSVRLSGPLRQALGVDIDTAIEPERDRPDRQFDIIPVSLPPTCRIPEPADGDENLGFENDVKVTCSDVPDSLYVWILVYSYYDSNYYSWTLAFFRRTLTTKFPQVHRVTGGFPGSLLYKPTIAVRFWLVEAQIAVSG